MEEKEKVKTFCRAAILIVLGVALLTTGCATGSHSAKGATDAYGGTGGSTIDYRGIEPMGNPSETDMPPSMPE